MRTENENKAREKREKRRFRNLRNLRSDFPQMSKILMLARKQHLSIWSKNEENSIKEAQEDRL